MVGPLVNYGYSDDFLLLIKIKPPRRIKKYADIKLIADVQWLECKDVCIPANATMDITLIKNEKGNKKDQIQYSKRKADFFKALHKIPLTPKPGAYRIYEDSKNILIRFGKSSKMKEKKIKKLYFFPYHKRFISDVAPQETIDSVDENLLFLKKSKKAPKRLKKIEGVLTYLQGKKRKAWEIIAKIKYSPKMIQDNSN